MKLPSSHKLIQHIRNAPVIPSDWTKEECKASFDKINGQMHDLAAEMEQYEMKHGHFCPHLDREALEMDKWLTALEEAIKTR